MVVEDYDLEEAKLKTSLSRGGDWFDRIWTGETSIMGTTTKTMKYKLNDAQSKALLKARQDAYGRGSLILTIDGAVTDISIGSLAAALKVSAKITLPLAIIETLVFVGGNYMAYDYGNQWGSALEKYNALSNASGLYIVDEECTVKYGKGV